MKKPRYLHLGVIVIMLAGLLGAWSVPGCQQRKPGKAMHELRVQAEKAVRLFDVQVKFGEQTIPFGVVSKGFARSWFPVRYEPGEDFEMEIVWQEDSNDASRTSTVTIIGPTEAERSRFDGVMLTYTKADGWTGKVQLKDVTE
jgi:hypothetical protein